MATALDVITLEEAKDYLAVDRDYTFHDGVIARLIKTAVALVEKHTSHRLYPREEVRHVASKYEFYDFPARIVALGGTAITRDVETEDEGETVIATMTEYVDTTPFTLVPFSLHSLVTFSSGSYERLVLQVGYEDADSIPAPLLDACYKLLTYFYEHRDAYKAELPSDVYVMLQPYRRYASI